MVKRVVIVGGVAGGASTAARLRRLDENVNIVMLEKGPFISFANCGLPYHIGEIIKDRDELILQTPEEMGKRFNIDIRVNNEVKKIHKERKTIEVFDSQRNMLYELDYDILVLSPGSSPLKPQIEGIDGKGIFTLWTIPQMDEIIEHIKTFKARSAVVVGGGFVGIEAAENLHEKGIKVSIVELLNQVMTPLDYDMAQIIHQHISSKGIDLCLNDGVKGFSSNEKTVSVNLKSGKTITADIVILAMGIRPNTILAKEAGLLLNDKGGIVTDEHMKTSDEFIYSVGDAAEITDFNLKTRTMVPLAGPANKQARICAENICGIDSKYDGAQSSSIVKVFDLTAASTGLNEKVLNASGKELNKDYKVTIIHPKSHAGYYPGAVHMTLKLIFSLDGKVLGAQGVGYGGVDKRIDVIAASIRFGGSVKDLCTLELCYAPPYSSAKDPVNLAGCSAENILNGLVDNILVRELDSYDKGDIIILDVRTKGEREGGFIEGSLNIPLDDLRDRLNELPKDKLVIAHCAVGFRSYLACRILIQHGFMRVKNLAGGYTSYRYEKADYSNKGDAMKNQDKQKKSNEMFIDACGLQCPGPIMKIYSKIQEVDEGDILTVSATDPGFTKDIESWCEKTGNTLMNVYADKGKWTVEIMKGSKKPNQVTVKDSKSMVVFSGDLDKALASFIIANGAAAMGKGVTMFFTFWGLNILRKANRIKVKKSFLEKMFGAMMPRGASKLGLSKMNMAGMGTKMMKYIMKNKNVNTLEELIESAMKSGVKIVACTMSMDVMGIKKEELIEGIDYAGVATFLSASEDSGMTLFI